jgi:hypothetical protein
MNIKKIANEMFGLIDARKVSDLQIQDFINIISDLSYSDLLKLKSILLFEVKSLLIKDILVPKSLEDKVMLVMQALQKLEK